MSSAQPFSPPSDTLLSEIKNQFCSRYYCSHAGQWFSFPPQVGGSMTPLFPVVAQIQAPDNRTSLEPISHTAPPHIKRLVVTPLQSSRGHWGPCLLSYHLPSHYFWGVLCVTYFFFFKLSGNLDQRRQKSGSYEGMVSFLTSRKWVMYCSDVAV